MTQVTAPTPEDVGQFYDDASELLSMVIGTNLHYGYWTGPEDRSDLFEGKAFFTELLIDKLRVGPGKTVLDVGCGSGGPGIRLAQRTAADVTGITVSLRQVEQATKQAAADGVADRVRFRYADAMNLPFDSGTFDAVLAFESVTHMSDRGRALREMARVLRPGGRVVLTDFFARAPLPPPKRAVVEQYYRGLKLVDPDLRIDDYPVLVRETGLLVDELTDVTDHVVRPTILAFEEFLKTNRGRLEAQVGPEALDQFAPMELAEIWELGYLTLVAHLPTRAN